MQYGQWIGVGIACVLFGVVLVKAEYDWGEKK
jgi:hypothetical protein